MANRPFALDPSPIHVPDEQLADLSARLKATRWPPDADNDDWRDYFQTIDGERLWREDRISALLSSVPDELPGVLFVQGTTRNQVIFYPRFDHIVLLSAPPEALTERLATRTTNPYGTDPAELAETLEYQQTVEPLLRASATLEVVTTVPVARVAGIVLDHVL
jgi:hypothetical protein